MERRTFLKDSATVAAFTLVGASLISNKIKASNRVLLNQATGGITPLYPNETTIVRLKGKEVKIHSLCTGIVAVKTAFRTKKGDGFLSKLNILFDNDYTEYMPIWVWVIEHPEGNIMIDTGETISATDRKNYLAKESAYSRFISQHTSKFLVDEHDSINYKLEKVNLKTEDIKLTVLTHLHLDHTDGLKFFPKSEVMVSEFEFKHPYSNLPTTYPSWFKPNLINYKPNMIDVFDVAYPVTRSEDLLIIPTPGHSNGNCSIVFKTDDFDIIFAGDTSYTQEQVLDGEIAGVNIDFVKSKESYKNILTYANNHKSIYLPTHDGNAVFRLMNKKFLV